MQDDKMNNKQTLSQTLTTCLFCVFFGKVLAIAVGVLLYSLFPGIYDSVNLQWCASSLPQYLISTPLVAYLLKHTDKGMIEKKSLTIDQFFSYFSVTFSLAVIGSYIGQILTFSPSSATELASTASPVVTFLFTVILAPIFEEWLYRELLLSRLAVLGELPSLLLTSLIFGLMHGNLSQFVYAFLAGGVLGYVYLKTGRVQYGMLIHSGLNLIGGFLPTIFGENALWEGIYLAFLMYCSIGFIAEIIVKIIRRKQPIFNESPVKMTKKEWCNLCCTNPGVWAILLLSLFLFFL